MQKEESGGDPAQGVACGIGRYAALLPCVIGLALARVALLTASADSYMNTDEGIFSDGAMALAVVVVALAGCIAFRRRKLSDNAAFAIIVSFSVGLAVVLGAMGVLAINGWCTPPVRFALATASCLFAFPVVACWVRIAGARDTQHAAALVFGGFIVSEMVLLAFVPLSLPGRRFVAALLALVQVVCALAARRSKAVEARDYAAPVRFDDCYVYLKGSGANARFFGACAVGIALLALVVGFLRGFPYGEPIPFTILTRVGLAVLTCALCAAFLVASIAQRHRAMTLGIWIVMELLAALTLVFYCAFPGNLEIGAVTVTALTTLMSAFSLYVAAALMVVGPREPLTYAFKIFALWICSRAIGRFVLLNVLPVGTGPQPVGTHLEGTHLAGTVVSMILLISTQVIMVKLMDVERFAAREEEVVRAKADESLRASALEADHRSRGLERFLGLDSESSLEDVRQAAMRRSAEELGRQFLLSKREVEVVTLYALGYTQKRLAEELTVSQETVRTHIKRIYAKCGLHSRQELVDYLATYAK